MLTDSVRLTVVHAVTVPHALLVALAVRGPVAEEELEGDGEPVLLRVSVAQLLVDTVAVTLRVADAVALTRPEPETEREAVLVMVAEGEGVREREAVPVWDAVVTAVTEGVVEGDPEADPDGERVAAVVPVRASVCETEGDLVTEAHAVYDADTVTDAVEEEVAHTLAVTRAGVALPPMVGAPVGVTKFTLAEGDDVLDPECDTEGVMEAQYEADCERRALEDTLNEKLALGEPELLLGDALDAPDPVRLPKPVREGVEDVEGEVETVREGETLVVPEEERDVERVKDGEEDTVPLEEWEDVTVEDREGDRVKEGEGVADREGVWLPLWEGLPLSRTLAERVVVAHEDTECVDELLTVKVVLRETVGDKEAACGIEGDTEVVNVAVLVTLRPRVPAGETEGEPVPLRDRVTVGEEEPVPHGVPLVEGEGDVLLVRESLRVAVEHAL